MKKGLPIFLLLAALASWMNVSGQNAPTIQLRTETLVVPPNASHFAATFRPGKEIVHGGRYYLIVQFEAIPTQERRLAIEALGVRLLDYLPDLSYIASIPVQLDLSSIPGVRGYMMPNEAIKLEHGIYNGQFPSWALQGDKIAVRILPYRDISLADILPDLRSRYETQEEYPDPRRATLLVRASEIAALARLPYVQFVEPIAGPSTPDDVKGRSLHRSNVLNSDFGAGRHYDGTGVTIGLADDGTIGPHIDFTGRLTQYIAINSGTHGDMTAGILFGAGNRDPEIRGHASGAYLHYWDYAPYSQIVDAVAHFNTLGVILTSTSYSQPSSLGGLYTTDAQFVDDQIHANRQLEHVFSAGNAGTADHGYGAGAGWGNITGGYKASKSVIACGNLSALGVLENSSSRGPADDGRIKPDICANGLDQLSTDENNTTQVGGGTSAASPSVAGCVTQLYQAYKSLNGGNNPESALIKASILNTGNELGNPGPDYKHGWGQINALRAVRILEQNRYLKDSVAQGQVRTHTLTVPANTTELRVMVYWSDYPGNPAAVKALVNDIDISVNTGSVFLPWVLNPAPNAATLDAPATRGVDNLNNMEQVTIPNPAAGSAIVTVTGSTIPQGPQSYYLVYEFVTPKVELTYPIGGEGLAPGTNEVIRWDASNTSGSYRLEYSTDAGSTWVTINNNYSTLVGNYTWAVPSVVTGRAMVRVTDAVNATLNDASDAVFTIVPSVSNIAVTYACPDSIGLSWTGASGATGYEISHLGAMYMDSTTVSTGTNAVLYGLNPFGTNWFSVSSLTANNGQGRRAIAISHTGIFNCLVPIDAALESIVSPSGGSLPSCQTSATTAVIVEVRNNGTSPASNIPVAYSLNGGAPVNEVVAGPLASGASINHTFTATVNMSAAGTYTLATWVNIAGDGNGFNDSASVTAIVINASPQTLPVTQNFESFSLCGTASDCETEVCALGGGWVNSTNLDEDDIDWRVSEGSTPSATTGPDLDHNPGTATGNYVYLEPSGNCFGKEAYLMSPCIDLSGSSNPQATYWYHMLGANMGTLHVDVLAEGIWTLDAAPPISGDQGNLWLQGSVNLVPYIGKTVNIRWRGETGPDFDSDMALDDILISEVSSAPIVNFTGDPLTACMGSAVNMFDLSVNNPNAWTWSISPNTFSFVGGSTQNSQNPQVVFNAPGTYSVTLTAANGFGSGNATQNAYITVLNANAPNFSEDFATFTPSGWSVLSSGGTTTWAQAAVTAGANGQPTDAAFMDNFGFNSPGAIDKLVTMPIDLINVTSCTLTFDVAYAIYGAGYDDTLRVEISTDCGVTWQPTGYNKTGATLTTAGTQTSAFNPASAGEWRNETIGLNAWLGNPVKIAFVNVNDFGNNLYIDNVNISSIVGIGQTLSGDWRVYPNPNNGRFSLEIDAMPASGALVQVHDLAGRVVYSQELNTGSSGLRMDIELTRAAAGAYTLSLTREGAREVRKLMVR